MLILVQKFLKSIHEGRGLQKFMEMGITEKLTCISKKLCNGKTCAMALLLHLVMSLKVNFPSFRKYLWGTIHMPGTTLGGTVSGITEFTGVDNSEIPAVYVLQVIC